MTNRKKLERATCSSASHLLWRLLPKNKKWNLESSGKNTGTEDIDLLMDLAYVQTQSFEQLKKSHEELLKMLEDKNNPQLKNLTQSIFELRKLSVQQRLTLHLVLDGRPDEFLWNFRYVLYPNEYLKLYESIVELINSLEYHILDDGYLRIVRIEIEEGYSFGFSNKLTYFFLTTNESEDPVKMAKEWFMECSTASFNPKLTSVKINYFKDMNSFNDFLITFLDSKNWTENNDIVPDAIDNLLGFDSIPELLKKHFCKETETFRRLDSKLKKQETI